MSPISYVLGLVWWGLIAYYVESPTIKVACVIPVVYLTVVYVRARWKQVPVQEAEADRPDGLV